ncbi:MAG: hypothetical protein KGD59_13415 [Candidatus Heimdallarchaeota archaeon]|nr:hypothetical protein [Candidatus Heimdallarchaeota archaeon]
MPVINSDNKTAGTICIASYPNKSNNGVRVVPYPMPKEESMNSQKNAIITITIIIQENSAIKLIVILSYIQILFGGQDSIVRYFIIIDIFI